MCKSRMCPFGKEGSESKQIPRSLKPKAGMEAGSISPSSSVNSVNSVNLVLTLKKRKRYTQGTKQALSEMSKVFLTLLSNVCNGIDRSIGSPEDEEFWTRCAEKMKTLSTTNHELSNLEFTTQTCIREFKSHRNIYSEIKKPSPKEKYRKLALTAYMPLLEEVYGRHYGKFSCLDDIHAIPESPPPASESLKRTDTDSTRLHSIHRSSGSLLELEVEKGVLVALKGLLEDDMLVLKDVAHAEAYLNRSPWASSLFLEEEDSKKRADMIIKSRKQDEEVEMRRRRILEEEEMKRRHMF